MKRRVLGENAMPTEIGSGSKVLDLFYRMGASRNVTEREIERWFEEAYEEDSLMARKALFYNRDIRGGQGERRSFRIMWRWLCTYDPQAALENLENVPYYGRWDDLYIGLDTDIRNNIIAFYTKNLLNSEKGALIYKWAPREGKKFDNVAKIFREYLGLTPKEYRNLLSKNTKVVEQLMCSNRWREIKYGQVPSVAANKYSKAFARHDEYGYAKYIQSVKDGKDKVNASAIFPHTIIKSLRDYRGLSAELVEEQWKALPDYVPSGMSFIPVCDVSGSMSGLPMEVSLALGLYLSERNKGIFKNAFITFSGRPQIQILKGSLKEKLQQLERADWEMNTNLEAVFNLILGRATSARAKPEELPQTIIILSDMQFDRCVRQPSLTAFEMIKKNYQLNGYVMPRIIFWNLRSSIGVPVNKDQIGAMLVSGFSPSVMKSVLNANTPMAAMVTTLGSERYSRVV